MVIFVLINMIQTGSRTDLVLSTQIANLEFVVSASLEERQDTQTGIGMEIKKHLQYLRALAVITDAVCM